MIPLIKKWLDQKCRNQENPLKKQDETLIASFLKQKKVIFFSKKTLLFFITSLLVTFLIFPEKTTIKKQYKIGEILDEDLVIKENFVLQDNDAFIYKQEDALKDRPIIFDFDPEVAQILITHIGSFFTTAKDCLKTVNGNPKTFFEICGHKLDEIFNLKFRDVMLYHFMRMKFEEKLQTSLEEIVKSVYTHYIIQNKKLVFDSEMGILTISNIITGETSRLMNITHVRDLGFVKELIKGRINQGFISFPTETKDAIATFLNSIIVPNIYFNLQKTEIEKEKIINSIEPVSIILQKGEIIARKGDKLDDRHIKIINEIRQISKNESDLDKFIYFFSVVFFIITLFFGFSARYLRSFHLSMPDLTLFCGFILLNSLIMRLFLFFLEVLTKSNSTVPVSAYKYAIPVFTTVMLVRIFFNSEATVLYTLVIGILNGLTVNNSISYFIFILISGFVITGFLHRCTTRMVLIKTGFLTGLICLLPVIFLEQLIFDLLSFSNLENNIYFVLMVFSSCFFSSIIALGISPFIELLGYTSDIKLLELANTDHPLLVKQAIHAPGTNHHSFVVGMLAENAAEAIGVNGLLARVASLYHDIGKIEKPHYFIENQAGFKNKHDTLSPRMSSLIIMSHVKDGQELCKKYNIPKIITDIIPQHHGTNLISFFFSRAKDNEDPDVDYVNENDYRYPGPKPQSKVAAIIMLADSVEAAARSIHVPTPAKLRSVVSKVITNFFNDGQLDDSDITLKDLKVISESFAKIITTSIFHQRIDYPKNISKLYENLKSKKNGAPLSLKNGDNNE